MNHNSSHIQARGCFSYIYQPSPCILGKNTMKLERIILQRVANVELLLIVCEMLLMLAGDIETNPGPKTKSSHDVFCTHTAELATCISSDLDRVTDKLYANMLIPLNTKDEILTAQGVSDSKKASKLVHVLDTMLDAARDPDEYFNKILDSFIEIDHRPLTDIANAMLEQITTLEDKLVPSKLGKRKSDNDQQDESPLPLKQSKQSQTSNDDQPFIAENLPKVTLSTDNIITTEVTAEAQHDDGALCMATEENTLLPPNKKFKILEEKEIQEASQPILHAAIPSSPSQDITNIDNNNDEIQTNNTQSDSASPMQNIRAYQSELIQPGLNGENYIICAPTGSGKTLMAACVIKDHLEKRGKNNAILFVVKTQQLAVQQKKKLEEYLKVFEVVEITGDHEDGKIYSILPQVDIVVCTAGKLLSELISKSLNISDVPLLVMDECHHTVGRDPYAEIMEYYLMARRESLPTPQVIGMTASPGAGSAKSKTSLAKAIEHQTKLCARLDATSGIKIVKDNVEELKKHVKPPDYENHTLPQRAPNDPFIHLVSDTMGRLEQMLPVQPSIQPPDDRSSLTYQQWLNNEIDLTQISETGDSQRDQISILEQLKAYSLAYATYEDFEFEHAKEDLTDVIIKDDEVMNGTEKVIQDMHQTLLSQLSQMEKCPNPMLKRAEEILHVHFLAKPDSKALFFVRDVKHTKYVTEWIKSSAKLRNLVKPASISGYSRKAGMPIQEQRATIDAFRSNNINLLVSTSVLEEGLDIPECNMVIRFQMMTNEIAEVQAQGRARAENSTLHNITVSNSNTLHHRLLNIGRKEMARDAVDHLARRGIAKHRILEIQYHIMSQRDKRIRAETENKRRWKTQNVELHCRKCNNFACRATDVCQYRAHYIVPNTAFIEERMKKMKRKGGRAEPKEACGFTRPLKIGCKICDEEWGAWGVWENGIQCPLLKCEKFTYYNKQTGHRENCKKWKNVPFEVVFYDELIEEHNKEKDDQ